MIGPPHGMYLVISRCGSRFTAAGGAVDGVTPCVGAGVVTVAGGTSYSIVAAVVIADADDCPAFIDRPFIPSVRVLGVGVDSRVGDGGSYCIDPFVKGISVGTFVIVVVVVVVVTGVSVVVDLS